MGLVVQVVDAAGGSVGDYVSDDQRHFERLLPDASDLTFRCLGFIDPYGDTVFNVQQIETLRAELQTLRQRAGAEAKLVIDAIDALAIEAQQTSPHRYLKFLGD